MTTTEEARKAVSEAEQQLKAARAELASVAAATRATKPENGTPTRLSLPPVPAGFDTAPLGAALHADWLMEVARKRGEPALDYAIGAGWPGTPMQRKCVHPHAIEMARNEARQLSSEVQFQQRRARGEWGV